MKKFLFFLTVLLTAAACNLSEENDLRSVTNDDQGTFLASTQQECDAILMQWGSNPSGSQVAALFECLLNLGLDQNDIEMNCDDIDSYEITSFCANPEDIGNQDISSYVPDIETDVASNTDDCPTCLSPDPGIGCRTIIYTVTYLDDECPPDPNLYEFSITARVFCC